MTLKDVENYIKSYDMLSPGDSVVTGVSGGADSVCLLLSLKELSDLYESQGLKKLTLCAVHLNHMIRGAEADRDEEFVRKLCETLGVMFFSFHEDIPALAAAEGLTVEEAGRKKRYELFEATADKLSKEADRLSKEAEKAGGAEEEHRVRIAVAHNRDDLVETVLFNLIRGSSVKGLGGIPPVRGRIIRPILFAGRDEIEEFLKERNQDFCTDSTNLSDDYTRNRMRHIILPELEKLNSGAVRHIADTADDCRRVYTDIEKRADEFVQQHVVKQDSCRSFEVGTFMECTELVRHEIIMSLLEQLAGRRKDITRIHIRDIEELCNKENGKWIELKYELVARRYSDRIEIRKKAAEKKVPDGLFSVQAVKISDITEQLRDEVYKNRYTELVDYDKIKGVLRLRKPEDNDSIIIASDGKRKKLRKLFTDLKIDSELRKDYPVIADDEDIIWIPGVRVSSGYLTDEGTTRALILRYCLDNDQN